MLKHFLYSEPRHLSETQSKLMGKPAWRWANTSVVCVCVYLVTDPTWLRTHGLAPSACCRDLVLCTALFPPNAKAEHLTAHTREATHVCTCRWRQRNPWDEVWGSRLRETSRGVSSTLVLASLTGDVVRTSPRRVGHAHRTPSAEDGGWDRGPRCAPSISCSSGVHRAKLVCVSLWVQTTVTHLNRVGGGGEAADSQYYCLDATLIFQKMIYILFNLV